MKTKHTNKFSPLQKELLQQQRPADVLRAFIKNPENKILAAQDGYLLIIPSWENPGVDAWSLQSLYDEISYIFQSRLLAQKICKGNATNAELEAVADWVLDRGYTHE